MRKYKKLQGPVCKIKFPVDLKPKWRNAQNESCTVFKLYNNILGPKFKNSIFIFLHVNLWTKVGFELLLSLKCNFIKFRT
jgi:hypothetical protein